MSAPECEFCASQLEAAEEIHAAGGWIEGGEVEFDLDEATAEYPTEDEPNYLVRFTLTEAPLTVHNGDGTAEEVEGSEYQVVVALQHINGRFIVFGVNAE